MTTTKKAPRQTGGWKGPSAALAAKPPTDELLSDPAFKRLLGDAQTLKFCRRCLGKKPDVALVSLSIRKAEAAGIPADLAAERSYALCHPCRTSADVDAWITRNLGFIARGACKPIDVADGPAASTETEN